MKFEVLTFIPETEIDPDNGEEYISKMFCLEQQKDFNVPPFMTLEILPGYLQGVFPMARVITNPGKN